MLIGVKEVGKPFVVGDTSEKYRSDCCGKVIGLGKYDRCDYIALSDDGLFLAVDEEGLLKDLPLNFYIHTNNEAYPVQRIVGTAVFVRIKPVNPLLEEIWDYEVTPITPSDLEPILRLLDESYQAELAERFKVNRGTPLTFRTLTDEELSKHRKADIVEFLKSMGVKIDE